MAEIPSPLPPKSVFRGEPSGEQRPPLVVMALQFFVIPLLIVLFCVGLYVLFRWLTQERRDVGEYLSALNARSESRREEAAYGLLNYIQEAKRWQSLSDLNDQLRFDREKFLRENPDFTQKIIQLFQEARGRDPRVVQYLSQVLALVDGPDAAEVLLDTLRSGGNSEQDIFVMIALGKLGDRRAVPLVIAREKSGDAGVRYAALFTLGFFDDSQAIEELKRALHNPDPLAEWNAAFSLARLSGRTGKLYPEAVPVLNRLLDLEFVQRVAAGSSDSDTGRVLSSGQVELYRIRAVQLLGIFLDAPANAGHTGLREELQKVADNDPQLAVRQAAIDVLNGHKAPVGEMNFSES